MITKAPVFWSNLTYIWWSFLVTHINASKVCVMATININFARSQHDSTKYDMIDVWDIRNYPYMTNISYGYNENKNVSPKFSPPHVSMAISYFPNWSNHALRTMKRPPAMIGVLWKEWRYLTHVTNFVGSPIWCKLNIGRIKIAIKVDYSRDIIVSGPVPYKSLFILENRGWMLL